MIDFFMLPTGTGGTFMIGRIGPSMLLVSLLLETPLWVEAVDELWWVEAEAEDCFRVTGDGAANDETVLDGVMSNGLIWIAEL